jgi:hypothetical protein
MLAFTQYELYEPAANEQANFDMLFPTIVRPINPPTNRPSSGRLSGSVSSLIAGVSECTEIIIYPDFYLNRIFHLKLVLFDNYHLVHHFNVQVLLFEFLPKILLIY